MAQGDGKRVRDALKKMKLTENENDSEKEPYVKNAQLKLQLDLKDATIISNERRNLIFARNIGISLDCIEDCYIVYTWRWSNDPVHAKIGRSMARKLRERLVSTYNPTDDPLLIGFSKCDSYKKALEREKSILNRLKRTRCDREWVKINADFNKLINEEFTRIEKTKEEIMKGFV